MRRRRAEGRKKKPGQLDPVIDEPTRAEAAKKFNVSETDVDRAKKVLASGTPELQQAVVADPPLPDGRTPRVVEAAIKPG